MADLSKTFLFRMTHIENVAHILQFGITHTNSANANENYKPIGDTSIIGARTNFQMPKGKHPYLSDYIPFYFSFRTPMLYVMQKGFNMVAPTAPHDIVYCVCTIQGLIDLNLPFVFTNGHAINTFTTYYEKEEVARIDELLDWKAIKSTFWNSETDLDLKRRKEAEFLVGENIPINAVKGFVVYNETAKNTLLGLAVADKKIIVRPNYYF